MPDVLVEQTVVSPRTLEQQLTFPKFDFARPVSFCGREHHIVQWKGAADKEFLCVTGAVQSPITTFLPVMDQLLRHGDVTAMSLPELVNNKVPLQDCGRYLWAANISESVTAAAHYAGYSQSIILGFSFGGPVSIQHAARFPEQTRALILIDLLPMSDPARYARFQGFLDHRYADTDDALAQLNLLPFRGYCPDDDMMRGVCFQTPDGNLAMNLPEYLMRATSPTAMDRCWGYVRRLPQNLPILILRAENSKHVSPETVDKFRKLAPQCRVTDAEIAGTKHAGVISDGGDRLRTVLEDFLECV